MIASKQMWWQILRKFMSIKIYISKMASVWEFRAWLNHRNICEKDATKFNLFKNKELKFAEAIGILKKEC